MDIRVSGMNLKIPKGVWDQNGREIPVIGGEFKIDPPSIISVENEILELSDEKPQDWMTGARLKEACIAGITLHDFLVLNSIIVKSMDGRTVYAENTDYIANHIWGTMGRIEGGRIKKGEKVAVSYKYGVERIDLLQYEASGLLSVKKGKEEKTCPISPEPDKDNIGLANIYLPCHASKLSLDYVYPIGHVFPKPSKTELEKKARFVPKTLSKLHNGKDVNIVFWGDSVTCGCDATVPEKAFTNLFIKMLKDKFSAAKINSHNAGIGGSNTDQRLPDLQKEVLDYNPDLVIIEFVNDMGFTDEVIRKNYYSLIDQIENKGAEIILIIPHFVTPSWMGLTVVKDAKETRLAAKWLKEIAAERKIGVADVSARWEHLSAEGIPYTTLLVNGINHPDDRGHLLFAEELFKFFQA